MTGARVLGVVVALACTVGCKKEPPRPTAADAGAAVTNGAGNPGDPASVAPTDEPDDPLYPKKQALPPSEAPRDNIDIPTGTNFVPGTETPPVAAPVDPLAGSIATARAGAVPCFAPLPSGDWHATLVVTVTPTGTVTRSEVEPGNVQDQTVIACLKSYAAGLSFAQSEGRTVRIDVHVKG
jgi:hypothetical protein